MGRNRVVNPSIRQQVDEVLGEIKPSKGDLHLLCTAASLQSSSVHVAAACLQTLINLPQQKHFQSLQCMIMIFREV